MSIWLGLGLRLDQQIAGAGGGGAGGGTVSAFTLNPASDPTAYPPALSVDLPPELDYATSPTIRVRRATAENMTTGLVTPSAVAIPSSGPVSLGLSGIASGTWYFQADILVGGVVTYTSNIALHGNAAAPAITGGTTFTTTEGSDYDITVTADRTGSMEIIGGRNPNLFRAQSGYGASRTLTLLAQNVAVDTAVDVLIEWKGLNGKTVQQSITGTITAFDEMPTAFVFTPVTGATVSTVYTSNVITIAGLGSGVTVAVGVTGGTYSKNGGGYTSAAGTATNGDTFAVRGTSSGIGATEVDVTLTVGEGTGTFAISTTGVSLATTNGVDKTWVVDVTGSPALIATAEDQGINGGARATGEPTGGNLIQFEAAAITKSNYGEMGVGLIDGFNLAGTPTSVPSFFPDMLTTGIGFRHDPGTGSSYVLWGTGGPAYTDVTSTVGTLVTGGAHPDVITFKINKSGNSGSVYLNHWNGSAYVSTLLGTATISVTSWKPAAVFNGGVHSWRLNFSGPFVMPLSGGYAAYA